MTTTTPPSRPGEAGLVDQLEATPARVRFAGEAGFCIFSTQEGHTIRGSVIDDPETLINTKLTFLGKWEKHPKYGDQFTFTSYTLNEHQIVHFLTRMVKGVPKKTAQRIVDELGEEVWDVLNNHPERLLKYSGIGEKKLAKIIAGWEKSKHLFELGRLLSPYGISNHLISATFDTFGESAVEVVTKNPYRLVEIRGVGFRKADEIARKLGVPEDSPERMSACLEFCLKNNQDRTGDSAIPVVKLATLASEALAPEEGESTITASDVRQGIRRLIDEDRLAVVSGGNEDGSINGQTLLASSAMAFMEGHLQELLVNHSVAGSPIEPDIDGWIQRYEETNGREFGDQQKEAIRLANELPRIFSITGYAGTGKTTTSKAILELLSRQFGEEDIVCCALSGIAASRVRKQSGFPAGTIHSVLGYGGPGEWKFDRKNKLPYKVILLDEATMVDTEIMYRLASAIDFEKSVLIMMGDTGQLPPVGAGAPFADMLACGLVRNVTLSKIYRQSEDKVITKFAEMVRQGKTPPIDHEFEDFSFTDISIPKAARKGASDDLMKELRASNNERIANHVVRLAKQAWPDTLAALKAGEHWEALTRFQVVSPMRVRTLGTEDLNRRIQEAVNPKADHLPEIAVGSTVYRTGDKVVHMRNKNMDVVPSNLYRNFLDGNEDGIEERRVFNGQIGLICGIDQETDSMHVYYPLDNYVAVYDKTDLAGGVVDLAYALSIHKTQGSEFHTVVFPFTTSHYGMLNAKLIYTGITRAKEKVALVGDPWALQSGCRKCEETSRVTCISAWHQKKAQASTESSREVADPPFPPVEEGDDWYHQAIAEIRGRPPGG